MRQIEKMVLLQTLDHLWREHLVTLEHLRQVIGFRSYGQRDPLNEYKSEGFHLFEAMLANLREAVTGQLMHIQGVPEEDERADAAGRSCRRCRPTTSIPSPARTSWPWRMRRWRPACRPDGPRGRAARAAADAAGRRRRSIPRTPSTWGKVSRNAPCPCGSGKKYKHCHGKHE